MRIVTRNTLLKYIPNYFKQEDEINQARINKINNLPIKDGTMIYLCERELRFKDNFALFYAIQKAKEFNLPLKVIHPKVDYELRKKELFITKQINQLLPILKKIKIDFCIVNNRDLIEQLQTINLAMIVLDFNPLLDRKWVNTLGCRVVEIDGHNIIPARFLSGKQEYSAATIRRKIYYNIYDFLTEYVNFTNEQVEADIILKDFIKNRLKYYNNQKNNFTNDVTSHLSKYLNLGFISSQRVALEVIKSDALDLDKESFLEELIIRKELADNFCLYAKNYKSFIDTPYWAQKSILAHKNDFRHYLYTLTELESAKTHDNLWNATQKELAETGKIHGYLRMYWAKKIFEWSFSPEIALKNAIYLNDKYAYDAPSSNGYVGILWAMGGLHDRAFKDWQITGKIRRMSYDSLKRKSNINKYINQFDN